MTICLQFLPAWKSGRLMPKVVELAGAQWRDSQKSLMVSVELARLIKKLHLPGSSRDEGDWDLLFFPGVPLILCFYANSKIPNLFTRTPEAC